MNKMNNLSISNDYFNAISPHLVDDLFSRVFYRKELLELEYDWVMYLKNYIILTYGGIKFHLFLKTFYLLAVIIY